MTNTMAKGKCFVITGVTASGKTTLVGRLLDAVPGSAKLVTSTSRTPRTGEVNGVDYHFLTRDGFKHGIARGDFLEWEENYGNLYGSSRSVLEKMLSAHRAVFAVLDVRGAETYMREVPEATVIFVDVPDEQIRGRIEKRAKMGTDELTRRMEAIRREREAARKFHHVIDNPDGGLDAAVESVRELVEAELSAG